MVEREYLGNKTCGVLQVSRVDFLALLMKAHENKEQANSSNDEVTPSGAFKKRRKLFSNVLSSKEL